MLFIPDKIKVGFQNRTGTYSGKLAYVIAQDKRGAWRKETSWESWRDKTIEPQEFENTPTEGFVLNKKVGGYKSDWNFRQAYSRVHDPRGFEFEIKIDNLLYILEHTNSIKGKGLEGEFVYSWDGKDLVLLPKAAPEFKTNTDASAQLGKFAAKDLVAGRKYLFADGEELYYLGRHKTTPKTYYKTLKPYNAYLFTSGLGKANDYLSGLSQTYARQNFAFGFKLTFARDVSKILRCTDETCWPDFAAKIEELQSCEEIHEKSHVIYERLDFVKHCEEMRQKRAELVGRERYFYFPRVKLFTKRQPRQEAYEPKMPENRVYLGWGYRNDYWKRHYADAIIQDENGYFSVNFEERNEEIFTFQNEKMTAEEVNEAGVYSKLDVLKTGKIAK